MMLQAMIPLRHDMHLSVLDASKKCPCAGLVDEIVIGSSTDFDDVYHFAKGLDIIILEFEHVNAEALQKLQTEGVQILCNPHDLEVIQDKALQKQFLVKNNIPTAPFRVIESKTELKDHMKFPFVLKSRKHGYDGGGVKKISSKGDLASAFDAPSIVEDCVEIATEYSLILGRDAFGQTFRYPVAEQWFHPTEHIVEVIAAPAKVSPGIQSQIDTIGDRFLAAFDEIGMWAVELFLDTSGTVLVNEIAPRVHNSGHQTIEGNTTSQFAQFVRLALGLPHGSTKTIIPAITVNILGPAGKSGKYRYDGLDDILKIDGVFPHFYGKAETRPFRKLGHVTVIGDNLEECDVKRKTVQQLLRIVVE